MQKISTYGKIGVKTDCIFCDTKPGAKLKQSSLMSPDAKLLTDDLCNCDKTWHLVINTVVISASQQLRSFDPAKHLYYNNHKSLTGSGSEETAHMAIDSCIEDGILEDILRKERARVVNSLIRGLTEEEVKELREWEIEHSYELGHAQRGFEAVDLLVDKGILDAETACETLKVDFEDYKKWKAEAVK